MYLLSLLFLMTNQQKQYDYSAQSSILVMTTNVDYKKCFYFFDYKGWLLSSETKKADKGK